jgi:hypothetical protein
MTFRDLLDRLIDYDYGIRDFLYQLIKYFGTLEYMFASFVLLGLISAGSVPADLLSYFWFWVTVHHVYQILQSKAGRVLALAYATYLVRICAGQTLITLQTMISTLNDAHSTLTDVYRSLSRALLAPSVIHWFM